MSGRGIYPPIAGLPSLSRLMKDGIGEGMTREDHPHLASQLFAAYSYVKDVRNLASVIGEEELTPLDHQYLEFGEYFERKFVSQGKDEDRTIEQTLDAGLGSPEAPARGGAPPGDRGRDRTSLPGSGREMKTIAPTKTNLLKLKDELKFARLGHELLDQKRNILVVELLTLVDQAVDFEGKVEEALSRGLRDPCRRLSLAMGKLKVSSVAGAINMEPSIALRQRKVMGVVLPVVETSFIGTTRRTTAPWAPASGSTGPSGTSRKP